MNMSDDRIDVDMIDVAGVRIAEENRHFVVYNSGYEVEVDSESGFAIIRALSQTLQHQFNAPIVRQWHDYWNEGC